MAKHDSIPVSSSKLPLFAPFAVPKIGNMATAWHEILHLGTKQRHSAGSIVKVEGETCFDLFYIDEGKVHVVFDTIDGRMRSVVSFEPGSIFNLAPAATRCEASGQYQCMTDAVIWQIPGKVLHDAVFAARYPNLMLSVIELLGTLVLTYHTYLTDMLMDDFVTRFSRFLISLSLERGSDDFPLGMTQEQLRESTRNDALRRCTNQVVLDAITKAEGFTASDEEVEAKIEQYAKQYNQDVDTFKKNLTDTDRTYMAEDVAIEKTLDFLVDNAKIVEKKEAKKAKKPAAKKAEGEEKPKKTTAKKTTAKKPAAKKAEDAEKNPAAKKPAAKKAEGEKNPAAKKTTAKKPAAKKTVKKTEDAE